MQRSFLLYLKRFGWLVVVVHHFCFGDCGLSEVWWRWTNILPSQNIKV